MSLNKKILTPKLISDPIRDNMIDIGPILPIVDTPEFQALDYKHQLGITFIIFPSAKHTRKAHSLGAYDATKDLCNRWLELGMISKEEAKAIPVYALLHDIGHYPFSHVTEWFFTKTHNDKGISIIKKLKKKIELCDVNFELVRSMAEHTNPLHLAVSDKNLGMEKLDYLTRDGQVTILDRPPGIQYLRQHIYWHRNQVVIDEKAIDASKDLQRFYSRMYKNVYLRKGSLICQRNFQKIVYLFLSSGEMSVSELGKLNDFELMGRLGTAKDKAVRNLFDSLIKKRDLFKQGIVLRYKDFVHAERTIPSKNVARIGLEDEIMDKLAHSSTLSDWNQPSLIETEKKIAKKLGLNHQDILLVTVVSPERFEPKDIFILNAKGTTDSLKSLYPNHFSELAESARAYVALRVCTKEKHRDKLVKNADLVKDIILESVR